MKEPKTLSAEEKVSGHGDQSVSRGKTFYITQSVCVNKVSYIDRIVAASLPLSLVLIIHNRLCQGFFKKSRWSDLHGFYDLKKDHASTVSVSLFFFFLED